MTPADLQRENDELRRRLAEAEDALAAIRKGEVDAIVIDDAAGTRVFSLAGAETVYRLALETMAEAVLSVTAEGTILFCNGRFAEFVGTPIDRVMGRDVVEFVAPEHRARMRALLEEGLRRPVDDRVEFCSPQGLLRPARLTANALARPTGVTLCLVASDLSDLESSAHQIEELRRVQARLRERSEQLHLALDAADAGTWKANLATGAFIASDRAVRMHGLPPGTPLNHESALARVSPADRDAVEAALRRTVETGEPLHMELRVPLPDGSIRWVATHAKRSVEAGQTWLVGLAQDISERKRAEALLAEREARYRAIFESTSVGMVEADPGSGRLLRVNAAMCRLMGFSEGELLARTILDITHPDDVAAGRDALGRLYRGEIATYEADKRYLRKDGESLWARVSANVVHEHPDGVLRVSAVVIDIGARKLAEEALRLINQRFETTLNATPVVVFTQDLDLRYTWIRNAAGGFKEADVIGKRDVDLLGETAEAQRLAQIKRAVIASGQSRREEVTVHPGGERHVYDLTVQPARDSNGAIVGVVCAAIDITARRDIEEAVRRSAGTFATLVEQSPLGIYTVDADFRLRNVSAGAMPVFSNVRPLIGRDFAEVMHAIWPEPFASEAIGIFRHTLDTGEPYRSPGLTEKRHDTGAIESYEWQTIRVMLEDGRYGVVCYFFDATRLQQANRAIRESEERFRALTRATNDVLYRLDRDWTEMREFRDRDVGDTANPDSGWLDKYVPPQDQPLVKSAIAHAIETKTAFDLEHRVMRWDGTLGWTHSRAIPILDQDGEIVEWFGAASDVTSRKLTEAALRESEERFRLLADHMSQLAWMAHPNGDRFWFNRRWYDYTGARFEEVRGWGWKAWHHPDHVERVVAGIQRCWQTGEPWEDTFPLRGKDGAYRWFLARAQPVRDEQGSILRWFGTNTDVTERLQLEHDLQEADRHKNEFLAMLSHELRNPLAAIRSSAALLKARPTSDPILLHGRDVIDRQVTQMVRLMDDLLDVARMSRGRLALRLAPVRIAEAIGAAIEATLPLTEQRGQKLVVSGLEHPILLNGDLARLTQVFGNLLNNAANYSPRGAQIHLSVERRQDAVSVSVRDTGEGLSADELARIFDLFQRGQRSEQLAPGGLGMGLALARQLVEMHGGTLTAESEGVGRGSTFTVHLPALPAQPASPASPLEAASASASVKRSVLVADDNADAADMLAMLLRTLGCEVRTVYGGEAAIQAAQQMRPDVVLLDLGMADLDGLEVCRRIRLHGWGRTMRVVAITGRAGEKDKDLTTECGFDEHLVKPVDPDVLVQVVQGSAATTR